MTRYRYLSVCLGAVALTSACAMGDNTAQQTGVQAKPMSLQQLATGTGCQVKPQQGSAELTQGLCETSQGKYVLVSFTKKEGVESWLNEAKPWGGHYLQGPSWVIVGTEPQLKTFQTKVGGVLVDGEDHGSGEHTGTHTP
jgi:hypothetical protein